MWAFPGGVLEAFDARVVDACDGRTSGDADRLLNVRNGLMYYVAAIRELFEETGVLLGSGTANDVAALSHYRDRLNDGSLDWPQFVAETGQRLDCSTLHYLSFWITPEGMPRRFATRFFVAELPTGQTARHCGGELTESAWTTPAAALERHRAGSLPMIFPTITTLEFLRDFRTANEVLAAADVLAAEGIEEILPRAVIVDGERRVIMPGEPGYAESRS